MKKAKSKNRAPQVYPIPWYIRSNTLVTSLIPFSRLRATDFPCFAFPARVLNAGRTALPPLLDPASRELLSIRFVDASLRDILDFIGNATGINVIYDSQFQDRLYSVALDDVTIEEALDLILTANGYFYKVLSPRSVAVSIR